jgi:hypothetical protein
MLWFPLSQYTEIMFGLQARVAAAKAVASQQFSAPE